MDDDPTLRGLVPEAVVPAVDPELRVGGEVRAPVAVLVVTFDFLVDGVDLDLGCVDAAGSSADVRALPFTASELS